MCHISFLNICVSSSTDKSLKTGNSAEHPRQGRLYKFQAEDYFAQDVISELLQPSCCHTKIKMYRRDQVKKLICKWPLIKLNILPYTNYYIIMGIYLSIYI